MEMKSMDLNRCKIPLVFAVSGDEYFMKDDFMQLEIVLERIFKDTREQYPNTPFVLLSPLFNKTEILAARIFTRLNESDENFKGKLVVPMHLGESTFFNEIKDGFHDEVKALLSKAESKYLITEEIEDKEEAYSKLIRFLVDKSQVLIAIHSEENNRAIKYKLTGEWEKDGQAILNHKILESIDTGPVYYIDPYNMKKSMQVKNPVCYKYDEEAEQVYDRIQNALDYYNMNFDIEKSNLIKKFRYSVKNVIDDQSIRKLSDYSRDILAKYSAADIIAIKYDMIYKIMLKLNCFLGFVTVLAYLLYADIIPKPEMLIGYIMLMSCGFSLYAYIKYFVKLQNKYLDYRALAEGLRVKFFLSIINLGEEVSTFYLERQKGELAWIRNAFRGAGVEHYEINNNRKATKEEFHLLHEYWIKKQRHYYRDKIESDRKKWGIRRGTLLIIVLFLINIIMITTGVVMQKYGIEDFNKINVVNKVVELRLGWNNCIKFISGLSILLISVIKGYLSNKNMKQNTNRYMKMREFYLNASAQMFLLEKDEEKTSLLLETVGKEALVENAEWLLLQREEKPEVKY